MPRNRKDFIRQIVSARDIQPGDFLDMAGKVRVHAARQVGESIFVAHKLRGSKAPGMSSFEPDKQVAVYRKPNA